MSKSVHYDVHICTPGVNHVPSEDCWCEPTKNYWIYDAQGRQIHVLEHNDTPPTSNSWVEDTLFDTLSRARKV